MTHIKKFSDFVDELDKKKDQENRITIDEVNRIILENNLSSSIIKHPLSHDKWIYRLAIIILGLIVLLVLVLSAHLICCCDSKEVPSGIIAIGATSVGALAGLISVSNKTA